jgi:hypothetical protein
MAAHQARNAAARFGSALAVELLPVLVGTVDMEVGLPDKLNLPDQLLIALGPGTAQIGIAPPGWIAPVGRWGNLEYFADRLDPIGIPALINVGIYDFSLRSSSACAKKALAVRRI